MNVRNKGTAAAAGNTDAPRATTSAETKEGTGGGRRTLCVQMAELSRRHRLARQMMLELSAAGLPAGTRDIIRAAFSAHGVTLNRMDITGELLGHRPRRSAARSAS